jgi:NitT/TauT family transport system substrate-binding protein
MRGVWIGLLALVVTGMAMGSPASAQTVRIAEQFGIGYLPLFVMRDRALLEAEGHARGLTPHVEWVRLSSGAAMNDALLAGALDIAAGGTGPSLILWAKTRNGLKVKGLATLNAMPLWLTTTNPNVKSLRDFSEQDRIALPAVKVSGQAVTLQMAARQAFGAGQEGRLDHLTVSMSHPDGMAAMLLGHSPVSAHFTSAPFMYQEAAAPGVHVVLNSYDVLGGPHTFNLTWATSAWHDANPAMAAAFLAALERSMAIIRDHPAEAAAIWLKAEGSAMPVDQAAAMIARPENQWTTAPRKMVAYGSFMHETGAIPVAPERWQDLFFPELVAADGS